MNRLCIRTRALTSERVLETWLLQDGPHLAVTDEAEAGEPEGKLLPLPPDAVAKVFARYGKPMDVLLPPLAADDAMIFMVFEDGRNGTLRAFAYRAATDVIANDYLVLERDGEEPLAGPAPLVAPAILALARAVARRLGKN